jgi:hypothetical protein
VKQEASMSGVAEKVFEFLMLVACFCALIGAADGEAKPNTVAHSQRQSESNYKADCQEVPIGDLTKNPDQYKGKRIKYTGQILVMDFPEETESGGTPYGLVLSIVDESHALPSGVLPVYVTYHGDTDSFIYDNVTVYGSVYGQFEYESATVQKKTLPRIDAKYLEKVQ